MASSGVVAGAFPDRATGRPALPPTGAGGISHPAGHSPGTTFGSPPGGMVYAPGKNRLFVSAPSWGRVIVLNASSLKMTANLTVGSQPGAMALDPTDGLVFVANNGSNNVSLIGVGSDRVVGTIPVGSHPTGVAYLASLDWVYVANYGSSNVTVIDAHSRTVVGSVPTLSHPFAAAALSTAVAVTHPGRNTVTVIDSTAVAYTVSVGKDPVGIVGGLGVGDGFMVTDKGANTVSVPGATPSVLPVGTAPEGITLDPGSGLIYVANSGSSTLTVLRNTSLLGGLSVAQPSATVLVEPATGTVVAGAASSPVVDAVPGFADQIVASVTTGAAPGPVVVDPSDGVYCVADVGGTALTFVNETSWSVTGTTQFPGDPISLNFDPTGDRLLVAMATGNDLLIVDPRTTAVVADLPIGTSAGAAQVDPANGLLYVTEPALANVAVFNLSSGVPVANVSVGAGPSAIAVDTVAGQIAVADRGANEVTMIDPRTDTVTATVVVGGAPGSLVFDPDQNAFFVANNASANVSRISGSHVVASIPVGLAPEAIAYDPSTRLVYVANNGSGNVSVFVAATGKSVASIDLASLDGVAVDGRAGRVLLTESSTSSLALVNEAPDSVLGTVQITFDPSGFGYQSTTSEFYAGIGDAFDAINGATGTAVAEFSNLPPTVRHLPGPGPVSSVTSDPRTGEVYVGYTSGDLQVLNGTTHAVNATLALYGVLAGALDPVNGLLYFLSRYSPGLSAINRTTHQFVANLSLGGSEIFPNPVTGDLYVLAGSTVDVVQASTNSLVQTIALPNPAVAGAVNGNGSAVWVVGQGGLEELNLTYGTATSGPGVGVDPTAIKFDKASGEFLVLNSGSDNLTLLNATTNAVSGQIPLAGTPEGQAVKVGPGLYAILLDDPASVEIVNATMRTVVRILPLHLGFSQFAHGSLVAEGADTIVRPGEPLVGTSDLPLRSGVPEPVDPVGIADGFVLQASQNAVFYLDPGRTYCGRHNTPCPKVIAVGQDPRGILYDPAVGRIFVTNTGSDNVSVLNATPFAQVIATLAVGPAPGPMALDPSNGRLYVADQGGDNLTVLDPAALTVVGSVAVGTHPSALSFDKFGKFLYVANAGSGNVSVVNALTGATSGSIGGVPGVDAVLAGASVGAVYVASATSGVVTLYASAIARWSAFVGVGPQLFGQFINDPMRILVALDETDSVAVLFTGP